MRAELAILGLLALGCSEDAPVDGDSEDTDVVDPCAGVGEGTLELGSGGRAGFQPFEDGEAVALQQDASGWGLRLELLTTGLDTTEAATSVVRVRFEPGAPTEDYLGKVMLQCDPEEGIAWIAVHAPIPEPWQSYPASLAGATLEVSATVTDHTGEAATDAVSLVVAAR